MKILKKESRNIKKVLVFTIVALVVLFGTVAALEKFGVIDLIKTAPPVSSGPSPEEQTAQKKAEQQKKQDFVENDAPTHPVVESTSLELSAKQETDGTVTVLTKAHNTPEGTCNLTVTNAGNSYTASAQLIYQPEFSSCAGFSIPVSKLGPGTWNIKLSVVSTDTTEKIITLEVQ